MKKLQTKYCDLAILPAEVVLALEEGEVAKTIDGHIVKIHFLSTWNTENDKHIPEIDKLCQKYYKLSFSQVRSVWQRRYTFLRGYWVKVAMDKQTIV